MDGFFALGVEGVTLSGGAFAVRASPSSAKVLVMVVSGVMRHVDQIKLTTHLFWAHLHLGIANYTMVTKSISTYGMRNQEVHQLPLSAKNSEYDQRLLVFDER